MRPRVSKNIRNAAVCLAMVAGAGSLGCGSGAEEEQSQLSAQITGADLAAQCPGLPSLQCTGDASYCGQLVAFEPDYGTGYVDYPENGETWTNQYRSFVRRDVMMMVKYAAAYVDCLGEGWKTGNGLPVGLVDMSESNGAIPGTSVGSPGHPAGTHTNGKDIDISYFQVTSADNRARPICNHSEGSKEAYHCVDAPTNLDTSRNALFIGALFMHPQLRVIGVDGKVGPLIDAGLRELCGKRLLNDFACSRVGKSLAYEPVNKGMGWFYFHHHHMHVSLAPTRDETLRDSGVPCLVPGCDPRPLEEFLSGVEGLEQARE